MTTEQVKQNRDKAQAAVDALRRSVESGVVWNAEFEDLKSRLGGAVWRDTEAFIWPAMRNGVDEAFKYPVSPSSVHDVRSFSKKIEAGRAKGLTVPASVDEFLAFWTPVVTLFDEAKPLIKKGRRPAENVDDSERRTLENTGTCPVCGKNVKRDDSGLLVHHGYTVEYHEFVGGCYGVGHLPIEVSPEGLQAYEEFLQEAQSHRVKALEEWESGKNDEVKVYDRRNKVHVAKGEARYQALVDEIKNRLQYEIRSIGSELENVDLRLQTWAEQVLPGILAGFDR